MPLLEDVAIRVASRTLKLMKETGDEDLEKKVADQIGASSPTLQEAFTTALRILKAEARATQFIDQIDGVGPPPEPETVPAETIEAPVEEVPDPEQEMLEHTIILGDGTKEDDFFDEEDDDEVMALPSPSMSPRRVSST